MSLAVQWTPLGLWTASRLRFAAIVCKDAPDLCRAVMRVATPGSRRFSAGGFLGAAGGNRYLAAGVEYGRQICDGNGRRPQEALRLMTTEGAEGGVLFGGFDAFADRGGADGVGEADDAAADGFVVEAGADT
jgi:hypothetical protein